MGVAIILGAEGFAANFASKWFDAPVGHHVFLVVLGINKGSIALSTAVGTFSSVNASDVVIE